MGEHERVKRSKVDLNAANQMLGNTMRIVTEPLFKFGYETESYTEADVDKLMAQECGISPRRKRNISRNTSF
ncbi:MAG: hypothetical protein Q7R43_01335 [Candidatus Daviesbacteria bacterium]|nr:hypothetical protein [Candidatus Daviesbacteria bacterium]